MSAIIIIKKLSCRQSSIQADKAWTSRLEMAKLNFWGAFSGWGLGTRLGVVFEKRLIGYSSLVLFPLLTQWGSIMKVRTDSKLTGMLLSVLIVTVVMHFRELLATRLCGVIDDDAWPPWVGYLAELLCGGKIFKLAPFVAVSARKQHLTATGAGGWWHSIQETNKREAKRKERTLLNHTSRNQGSEGR